MRARIDQFLNSWVSKKLSVFVIACFGLFSGVITDSEWTNIALVYISAQSAVDIVAQLRGSSKNNID